MTVRNLPLLLLCLALGSTALAQGRPSRSTKAAKDPRSSEAIATETEREFLIPVPKSEIQLEPFRYVPPRPTDLEISSSTWLPENLTRSNYMGQVSRFRRGSVPNLALNRIGQVFAFNDGTLVVSSKLGVTYFDMVRSTSRTLGLASGGEATQRVNFLMGRVGVETTLAKVLPWRLEPAASFALLPTWVSATKSVYEDDISKFGLPYEATAGLLWRVTDGNRSDFGDVTIGVEGHAVSGSVAGSSLKGFGILGEFRVSL